MENDKLQMKPKLGVFHPVLCTYNFLYLTVVTQQCGAMLFNYTTINRATCFDPTGPSPGYIK